MRKEVARIAHYEFLGDASAHYKVYFDKSTFTQGLLCPVLSEGAFEKWGQHRCHEQEWENSII